MASDGEDPNRRAPAAPGRVVAKVAWPRPDSEGGLVMNGAARLEGTVADCPPSPGRTLIGAKAAIPRRPATGPPPRGPAAQCRQLLKREVGAPTGWPITVFSRSGAVGFGSLKVDLMMLLTGARGHAPRRRPAVARSSGALPTGSDVQDLRRLPLHEDVQPQRDDAHHLSSPRSHRGLRSRPPG